MPAENSTRDDAWGLAGAPEPACSDLQLLRARAFARDGFLFLGLGVVGIVVAIVLPPVVGRETPQGLISLIFGLASSLSLWGMGLWKLAQADDAGLRTAVTRMATVVVAYFLVLLLCLVAALIIIVVRNEFWRNF